MAGWLFVEILRAIGLLMLTVGALLMAAGLLYWAAGWRYGGVVAIWTAEWGLPVAGLGAGLWWLERRAAGVVAVAAALVGLLLVVLDEATAAYGSYIVPCAALDSVAALLGATILLGYTTENRGTRG